MGGNQEACGQEKIGARDMLAEGIESGEIQRGAKARADNGGERPPPELSQCIGALQNLS